MIDDANQRSNHGQAAIGAARDKARVGPIGGNRPATEINSTISEKEGPVHFLLQDFLAPDLLAPLAQVS